MTDDLEPDTDTCLSATGIAAAILAEWAERGLNAGDMLNVDILADAIQRHVVAGQTVNGRRARDLAVAEAALEAAAQTYEDGFPAWDVFGGAMRAIRALNPAKIIADMEGGE